MISIPLEHNSKTYKVRQNNSIYYVIFVSINYYQFTVR